MKWRGWNFWQRGERRFRHMAHLEGVLGTSLELQVVATEEAAGPRAEAAVLTEIDRLEAIFNAYNPNSELRCWQQTQNESVEVSAELAQVLAQAERWRVTTGGAFNPAVEGATQLWRRCADENRLPNTSEIEALLEQMQGPLWEVDSTGRLARRLTTLPVTLNAIAKGFIIDSACQVAQETAGVREVLVNIGGDICHAGSKAVTVAITNPYNDAENSEPLDRVQLWNTGLATSGNYRRGFSIQGQWYSHLLDPRTLWPVEFLVGVSVLAPDAASADVLATAFSVLAPEASLALADEIDGVGVLLLDATESRVSNARWEERRA